MLADVESDSIHVIGQSKGKDLGIVGDLLDFQQLGLEGLVSVAGLKQTRH